MIADSRLSVPWGIEGRVVLITAAWLYIGFAMKFDYHG